MREGVYHVSCAHCTRRFETTAKRRRQCHTCVGLKHSLRFARARARDESSPDGLREDYRKQAVELNAEWKRTALG